MEVVKQEEGELAALSPAGVTNVQLWLVIIITDDKHTTLSLMSPNKGDTFE